MKGDVTAAEELQQKFAQVVKPRETRKCEKTMSGDHIWPEWIESGTYPKCLACGIINDLDTKE